MVHGVLGRQHGASRKSSRGPPPEVSRACRMILSDWRISPSAPSSARSCRRPRDRHVPVEAVVEVVGRARRTSYGTPVERAPAREAPGERLLRGTTPVPESGAHDPVARDEPSTSIRNGYGLQQRRHRATKSSGTSMARRRRARRRPSAARRSRLEQTVDVLPRLVDGNRSSSAPRCPRDWSDVTQ